MPPILFAKEELAWGFRRGQRPASRASERGPSGLAKGWHTGIYPQALASRHTVDYANPPGDYRRWSRRINGRLERCHPQPTVSVEVFERMPEPASSCARRWRPGQPLPPGPQKPILPTISAGRTLHHPGFSQPASRTTPDTSGSDPDPYPNGAGRPNLPGIPICGTGPRCTAQGLYSSGVRFRCNQPVHELLPPETARGPWRVNEQPAGAVILAAGGYAAPALGSDGSGLDLARSLGYELQPPVPP